MNLPWYKRISISFLTAFLGIFEFKVCNFRRHHGHTPRRSDSMSYCHQTPFGGRIQGVGTRLRAGMSGLGTRLRAVLAGMWRYVFRKQAAIWGRRVGDCMGGVANQLPASLV